MLHCCEEGADTRRGKDKMAISLMQTRNHTRSWNVWQNGRQHRILPYPM